jgi:hypothetical protein
VTPLKCQKLPSSIPKTAHVKFRATSSSLSTTLWCYHRGQNQVVVMNRCLYLILQLQIHKLGRLTVVEFEFPCLQVVSICQFLIKCSSKKLGVCGDPLSANDGDS